MNMKKILVAWILFFPAIILAQFEAKGTVTDDEGNPLPGVLVTESMTNNSVTTDFDGNFVIEVASDGASLIISSVGFNSTEIMVDSGNLSVQLSPNLLLDEVTVTALGSVKENRSIGYAVQSVDSESITNANETNIVNALQGQIAGVQIQGSPSTLGGSSRITIRGSNSFLGNNQPLFVVDGVPINNSNFSNSSQQRGFGGGDYDYGNMASDIDASTIKTVNVLKGAAATALYGSRGANGVILIVTKDGSEAKEGLGVTINSNVTFDNVTNLVPLQQVYGGGSTNSDYAHGFSEVIQNGTTYLYPNYPKDGSWGPKYDPNVLVRHWDSWDPNSPQYLETRPWVAPPTEYSDFFDTGISFTNNISLSGSNENGSFRLGYTNLDQKGTNPGGKLERNSISFNSSYNLSSKLSAGISINYVNTKTEKRNTTGYDNSNPMQAFTQWWQTQLDVDRLKSQQNTSLGDQYTWNAVGPVVDPNTNEFISYNFAPNYFDNPYWVRENFLQEDLRNRLFGNVNLSYDLMDNLSISTQFSTDWYQFSVREGIPLRSVDLSKYREIERRFQETNMDVRLNYSDTFADFELTALIGANRMKTFRKRSTLASSGGLVIDGFFNIANSAESPLTTYADDSSYDISEKGINSVYGSFSLGWNRLLYLDVAARNDWSSTLPVDDNSYFYPSTSLSFVFSEIIDSSIIDFGKFRASVAQAGSDASPYSLADVFNPMPPNFGANPLYRVPQSRQNPTLVNELTTEYEFGFDIRMLNNRLFIDAAYYDRTTKDQIFNVSSPSPTGYTSRLLNAGEMRNYGFELGMGGSPIDTGDFSWDLGLNLTFINNEVVSLLKDEDGNSVVENIAMGGTWAASLRIQEGYPYMALFGQDYTYDSNGNKIVGDDGVYVFTDDREYLGSAIADAVGGFKTSFSYKDFNLSALIDFQVGGIIHSTTLQWSKYSGMHPETVSYNGETDTRANGMVLPGVLADGSENTKRIDPQGYYQSKWRVAAPNVYDADYVKFRELRLSYSLPESLTSQLSVEDLSISLFGRNLGILSSDLPYLDPQIITGAGNRQGLENAQVPSTRSFGLNVIAKF